jgi:hypothetical protein
MTFPALFTVQYLEYSASGGVDAHGNEIAGWADPVERQVIGWGVPDTSEPAVVGHDRDTVDIDLFVPADWVSSPQDRVVLPDMGQMEQIGHVQFTTGNPFGWVPGHVVKLKQVNG